MKTVVILGNPGNGIFHQMIGHFLNENTHVYVIDGQLKYSHNNLVEIKSLVYLRIWDRVVLKTIPIIISTLDTFFSLFYFALTFQTLRLKELLSLPTLKRSLTNMIIHHRVLSHFTFDYVLCLNVYFYGFSSILSGSKFIGQPWGSDVNKYGLATPLRFFFMKRSLNNMVYIAPAGRSVIPFIEKRYGVPNSKLVFLPPTVDSQIFNVISDEEKRSRKKSLNLDPQTTVFFSCRRFAEGWGPSSIRELFIRLSDEIPNSFFIVLSGYNSNTLIEKFRADLSGEKLNRFLFLDRAISLEEFGYYSQISDFTVSAMTNRDMQSSSIMQSTACGAYPVLSAQEEYEFMAKEGLNMVMFKSIDQSLINTIVELLRHPDILAKKRNENHEYFLKRKSSSSYVKILNDLV